MCTIGGPINALVFETHIKRCRPMALLLPIPGRHHTIASYSSINSRKDSEDFIRFYKTNGHTQMVDPTIKTVQDLNARGLNQNAFAYVPEFCQNINNTCKLHVALHGCQQFTGWTIVPKVGSYFYKKGMLSFPFGNTFYYQSDFAAFAETNQMIVLFPQAWNIGTDASSVNPYGCWEFWPFTAADALNSVTRSGVQMGTIANMVKATTTQRFRH